MATQTRSRSALSMVLVLAGLCSVAVVYAVLIPGGGWDYFRAPLAERGYMPSHRWLRPSGFIGLPLGVAGAIAMLSTLPYAARKHFRPLARFGAQSKWLEIHIFFGIIGPVLVTLHTAFKFSGVVAVGYWLMMTVWSSGFVGRYLYVRIPKTIRGAELSRADLEADLRSTRQDLAIDQLPEAARAALDEFDRSVTPAPGRPPGVVDLFLGEFRVRTRVFLMRRHLKAAGADVDAIHTVVTTAAALATLERRLAHLERTRRFFALWHVFHRPLVFGMFLIVGLHVGVAVYLGYAQAVLGGTWP